MTHRNPDAVRRKMTKTKPATIKRAEPPPRSKPKKAAALPPERSSPRSEALIASTAKLVRRPAPERPRPKEPMFHARQLANLLDNYQRVDAMANSVALELQELRERLAAADRDRSELLGEIAHWRQAYELEFNRAQAMSDGIAAHYADATLLMQPLRVAAILDSPQRIGESFIRLGVTGAVENVRTAKDGAITGWATKRRAYNAKLLVALFDEKGCIGFGAPSQQRSDVTQILEDCDIACGFSFSLTRIPVGRLSTCLGVFPGDKTPPFSVLLPIVTISDK